MGTDIELLILEQIKELRHEIHAELTCLRADLRSTMVEVGALKVKLTAIATIAGFVAAGVMQLFSQIFFR